METPNRYKCKEHINEPLLILFILTKEQVIPLFAAVAIGMIIKQTLLLIGIALAYIYLTQKLKSRFPKGFVKHKIWSLGFIITKPSKSIVDPIKKLFIR
ncbi:type IV conjugative transfer system protein TraL [uncultured Pseudoalteromonas sp.]|uniref:type IV conjugative transfer system protein TraL n=1 Tax=uncultured Pseudoalteromonas sp. TaxID=114053 RepID=UPI002594D431|nr:type IV conjugative transfer system protein TraL [uncultured Pseudoalteromonas sp.]